MGECMSEHENSIDKIPERFNKLNEKVNDLAEYIDNYKSKNDKKSLRNMVISQIITIVFTIIITFINTHNQNKHLLETLLNNEKLAQLKNDNEKLMSIARFKYEILMGELKEKKETSSKMYNGMTDVSIFLFNREDICGNKSLNYSQKIAELKNLNATTTTQYQIIKSMHDIDGILGKEVSDELDDFGNRFISNTFNFKNCNQTPKMLSSDDIRIEKRKLDKLANKNIHEKELEIKKFLTQTLLGNILEIK